MPGGERDVQKEREKRVFLVLMADGGASQDG